MTPSTLTTWSFYDPETGALTGRHFSGPPELLALNTPEGHAAIEGRYDHLSKRVDLGAAQVVDWQPPQPGPDHVWNADLRRWVLSAASQQRQAVRAQALDRIATLEAAQHRAVREVLLEGAPEKAKRLAEIDSDIARLREKLT